MTDVFLERRFDPPIDREHALELGRLGADCLDIHRVRWRGSLLAQSGRHMVCRFSSADAESVRIALRQLEVQLKVDIRCLWPGTLHDAPGMQPGDIDRAKVLVRRSFNEPTELADIQAIEDAGAWCLETHGVSFVRTCFSVDRKRMICLYRAPDAESVRLAQRQAGMPLEDVWSFEHVAPASSSN